MNATVLYRKKPSIAFLPTPMSRSIHSSSFNALNSSNYFCLRNRLQPTSWFRFDQMESKSHLQLPFFRYPFHLMLSKPSCSRKSLLLCMSLFPLLTIMIWKRRRVGSVQCDPLPPLHSVDKTVSRPWFSHWLEAFGCIFRAIELFILFIPLMVTIPVMWLPGSRYWKWRWYRLLLFTLELCGPTFIKIGQWASTRPDIFHQDLILLFRKLHSQVPPHSFRTSLDIITDSFGDPSRLFEFIDEKPIGSGCIAQVHRAKLADSNVVVAIKVLRRHIERTINQDLKIMKFFACLIDRLPTMQWLSLPDEVDEFRKLMEAQLDLRREAENLTRFRENFSQSTAVSFPAPRYPLVTKNVLVEEFVDGVSIANFIAQPQSDSNVISVFLSQTILSAFLQMMVRGGM